MTNGWIETDEYEVLGKKTTDKEGLTVKCKRCGLRFVIYDHEDDGVTTTYHFSRKPKSSHVQYVANGYASIHTTIFTCPSCKNDVYDVD